MANAIAQSSAKGGSNSAATAQVLAQALASGNGQANAQAIGQAYTQQKGGVASTLAQALTTVRSWGRQLCEALLLVMCQCVTGCCIKAKSGLLCSSSNRPVVESVLALSACPSSSHLQA